MNARRVRLGIGDLDPWRERLVRYFANPQDSTARAAVFKLLETETVFEQSDLADAGQSYSVFRCEAFFYDVLVQAVTGPKDTAADRCNKQLQAVISEKCVATYEYDMAEFFLKRGECAQRENENSQSTTH